MFWWNDRGGSQFSEISIVNIIEETVMDIKTILRRVYGRKEEE